MIRTITATALVMFLSPQTAFAQSWVAATNPATNAIDVSPAQGNILITFDRDVDTASLTNATISVHGSQTGRVMSSNINYDSNLRRVTFDPDEYFKSGEIVAVSMTAGVRSASGENMPQPHIWQFTITASGGNGAFGVAANVSVASVLYSIVAGDWDGNGAVDLATANRGSNNISLLGNDGNGHIDLIIPNSMAKQWHPAFFCIA